MEVRFRAEQAGCVLFWQGWYLVKDDTQLQPYNLITLVRAKKVLELTGSILEFSGSASVCWTFQGAIVTNCQPNEVKLDS